MSTTKSTTASKFKLVTAIMALFKMGDEGKFISFFSRLERDFTRAIDQLKINLDILKSQYEQNITKLNEDLEDAQQAVKDAWLNINPDQIATNALQESFKNQYLDNISRAEDLVDAILESIKAAEEANAKEQEEINDQIKAYKDRINTLLINK